MVTSLFTLNSSVLQNGPLNKAGQHVEKHHQCDRREIILSHYYKTDSAYFGDPAMVWSGSDIKEEFLLTCLHYATTQQD